MRTTTQAAAALAATMALIGHAEALTITQATLARSTVIVSGTAAASAAIRWDGDVVAVAGRRGRFSFATHRIPAGCVGALSDGVTTVGVAIGGCTVAAPPPATPLLATGQTTCSDIPGDTVDCAGTGQDGEIRAGVVQRYTSHDDGTITDHNTGLVWEKKTAANMFDAYTWDKAFEYVAGLNAAAYAGHRDWRLPNVRELQSLIDYGRFDPAVAPEFDDCERGSCTVSGTYWTSTSAISSPILAWRVSFFDGFQLVGGKTFNIRVRVVRGGLRP